MAISVTSPTTSLLTVTSLPLLDDAASTTTSSNVDHPTGPHPALPPPVALFPNPDPTSPVDDLLWLSDTSLAALERDVLSFYDIEADSSSSFASTRTSPTARGSLLDAHATAFATSLASLRDPGSHLVAVGSGDGARVWDNRILRGAPWVATGPTRSVDVSTDGRTWVTGAEDGWLHVWDARMAGNRDTGRTVGRISTAALAPMGSWRGHEHWVNAVAFCQVGRETLVASGGSDGRVVLGGRDEDTGVWRAWIEEGNVLETSTPTHASSCARVAWGGKGGWEGVSGGWGGDFKVSRTPTHVQYVVQLTLDD